MKVILLLAILATPALADSPTVENVDARQSGSGWRFDVTLSHPDTGWEHYADGWRIETATGDILGIRELLHPHVNEQPFTRSLSGVFLPQGTARIYVRARCNVDGWSQDRFEMALPD